MNYQRILPNTPPAVKGLLLANVIMFALSYIFGDVFMKLFALYIPASEYFFPHQFITHLFMHGSISHIFFNMFALWMFGKILEQVWGSKRFLVYYFVTGLGAALLHTLVNYYELHSLNVAGQALLNTPTPQLFESFVHKYIQYPSKGLTELVYEFANNPDSETIKATLPDIVHRISEIKINIPTVGASGAVYGVLLAFGMLFPNTELMLIFPPIPIKAKYMVIGYAVLELVLGVSQPGSNIAHFAHLGGMLFGWILIKYWSNNRNNFY
ncbi:rhomboid family intramembrane serine protease [Halosquirtibacter xylanolyticus]|uniref:rhomboid family intramembrane serine protease n=1 Tax=Halosquirtibacter xylanolyticus TaxID=3374599 RepID=UPI0037490BFC|nr:rhomboid family intramembrane serine protease [Prolixibacteraceae bacterium]